MTVDSDEHTTDTTEAIPVRRLARVITEMFAPAILAAVMPLIIAVPTGRTPWIGLGWAALAVLFVAVLPYAIIRISMRLGRITGDHHISDHRQRRTPLLLGLVSVVTGLGLLLALHAPRPLIALVVVMLAVLLTVTAVNTRWKLSAHAAVAAGSVAVMVIEFGAWLLLTGAVAGAVCWSRVQLRDHTTAHVYAGAAAGVLIGAAVYLMLR